MHLHDGFLYMPPAEPSLSIDLNKTTKQWLIEAGIATVDICTFFYIIP